MKLQRKGAEGKAAVCPVVRELEANFLLANLRVARWRHRRLHNMYSNLHILNVIWRERGNKKKERHKNKSIKCWDVQIMVDNYYWLNLIKKQITQI